MLEFSPKMQWQKIDFADYSASMTIRHRPINFEEYLPMEGM